MKRRKITQNIPGNEYHRENEKNQQQLLVDVSTLVTVDAGTGIQRVVWNVLENLSNYSPSGYIVRPVFRSKGSYFYVDSFIAEKHKKNIPSKKNPIVVRKADIFLGLDFDHKFNRQAQRFLRKKQLENGLLVYFVVYDLLAVTHPEWFNRHLTALFKLWLTRVSSVADGLICISKSVAQELEKNLSRKKLQSKVEIGFFHLGADVVSQQHNSELSTDEKQIIQWFSNQTVLLMVGTLEPRKGHGQILDAMEQLWENGKNVLLVVAGKKGWKVEQLVQRINEHPENGEHLFWFENVSDAFLLQLYSSASALLMASEGEGFGLPLIEAAQHNLPIIVRDLPVFREVAGENAFYFSDRELSDRLFLWFQLYCKNMHPESEGVRWQTWAQSTQQLLNVILNQKWI